MVYDPILVWWHINILTLISSISYFMRLILLRARYVPLQGKFQPPMVLGCTRLLFFKCVKRITPALYFSKIVAVKHDIRYFRKCYLTIMTTQILKIHLAAFFHHTCRLYHTFLVYIHICRHAPQAQLHDQMYETSPALPSPS